jgi:hypothetical protein
MADRDALGSITVKRVHRVRVLIHPHRAIRRFHSSAAEDLHPGAGESFYPGWGARKPRHLAWRFPATVVS